MRKAEAGGKRHKLLLKATVYSVDLASEGEVRVKFKTPVSRFEQ